MMMMMKTMMVTTEERRSKHLTAKQFSQHTHRVGCCIQVPVADSYVVTLVRQVQVLNLGPKNTQSALNSKVNSSEEKKNT